MTLDDVPDAAEVFIDANIFVYAFAPDPQFGPASLRLLERIERNEVSGITSAAILSDVAHRLMTFEACTLFGWPYTGIVRRLKQHRTEVQQLIHFRQAIDTIIQIGVHVLPTLVRHIQLAAEISQREGLLSNDALIIAMMRNDNLSALASHDADFDGIADIQRYGLL